MRYAVKLPPSLPERLYFCRHGQSLGNARGLNDASLRDLANHRFPLSDLGLDQARQLARYVRQEGILADCGEIDVSTFLRAEQTLEIIRDEHPCDLPVHQDARLDEWWQGIYHSMTAQERERHYPGEDAILAREGWHHYRPPQGESGKDVELRLLSFLQDLRGIPFISGHGRSGAILDRLLCDRELDRDCAYPNMKNCELWQFTKIGTRYRRETLFLPS